MPPASGAFPPPDAADALRTLTLHSVAIAELDPQAANLGAILQELELPDLQAPLHHLYYGPTGRLYATGLDPKSGLAEVGLSRNAEGAAVIKGVT